MSDAAIAEHHVHLNCTTFHPLKTIFVQMAPDIEAISPRGVPRSVVHLGSVTCSPGLQSALLVLWWPIKLGGLGIRSACQLVPSAFLASAAGTCDTLKSMLPASLHNASIPDVESATYHLVPRKQHSPTCTSC